jgi:hypothetical protein
VENISWVKSMFESLLSTKEKISPYDFISKLIGFVIMMVLAQVFLNNNFTGNDLVESILVHCIRYACLFSVFAAIITGVIPFIRNIHKGESNTKTSVQDTKQEMTLIPEISIVNSDNPFQVSLLEREIVRLREESEELSYHLADLRQEIVGLRINNTSLQSKCVRLTEVLVHYQIAIRRFNEEGSGVTAPLPLDEFLRKRSSSA